MNLSANTLLRWGSQYFKAGYTVKKIVDMLDLDRKCPNVHDIIDTVKQALILSNIDKFTEGMLFTNFRDTLMKESFLKAIKNGAIDYKTLNIEFKGFKYVSLIALFSRVFNRITIDDVYRSLTNREQNRVIALHLIKKSLKETGVASRTQILADLLKIGIYREVTFLSGDEVGFEFLTGSSWNELYQTTQRYRYQSYHRVLRLLK